VIVGCNIPNGLRIGRTVLHGSHPEFNRRGISPHQTIGGYAITRNVPDDEILRWAADNRDSQLLYVRAVVWAETEDELVAVIGGGHTPGASWHT
jgi:hypothetical protein